MQSEFQLSSTIPLTMPHNLHPRVVIYDGVKWIINADKHRKIKFCCLQSKAAEPYLTVSGVTKEDVHKRFLFIQGLAALRDSVYDYVAKHRYEWFGFGSERKRVVGAVY